ncbi:unnamed protein product, partial [Choristocarpus tenellus]
ETVVIDDGGRGDELTQDEVRHIGGEGGGVINDDHEVDDLQQGIENNSGGLGLEEDEENMENSFFGEDFRLSGIGCFSVGNDSDASTGDQGNGSERRPSLFFRSALASSTRRRMSSGDELGSDGRFFGSIGGRGSIRGSRGGWRWKEGAEQLSESGDQSVLPREHESCKKTVQGTKGGILAHGEEVASPALSPGPDPALTCDPPVAMALAPKYTLEPAPPVSQAPRFTMFPDAKTDTVVDPPVAQAPPVSMCSSPEAVSEHASPAVAVEPPVMVPGVVTGVEGIVTSPPTFVRAHLPSFHSRSPEKSNSRGENVRRRSGGSPPLDCSALVPDLDLGRREVSVVGSGGGESQPADASVNRGSMRRQACWSGLQADGSWVGGWNGGRGRTRSGRDVRRDSESFRRIEDGYVWSKSQMYQSASAPHAQEETAQVEVTRTYSRSSIGKLQRKGIVRARSKAFEKQKTPAAAGELQHLPGGKNHCVSHSQCPTVIMSPQPKRLRSHNGYKVAMEFRSKDSKVEGGGATAGKGVGVTGTMLSKKGREVLRSRKGDESSKLARHVSPSEDGICSVESFGRMSSESTLSPSLLRG